MIGVILGTGWDVNLSSRHKVYPRKHLYQGHTAAQTAHVARQAAQEGCDTLVLTSASGAVNPDIEIGEVLCISDHINLTGRSLDIGFQPLPAVYTPVGEFRRGVYAQVAGPLFETPAEARMLRTLGADVVGMSTALEAVQAYHEGLRVVGLTLVTDYSGSKDGHEGVLKVAASINLQSVLDGVLEELA